MGRHKKIALERGIFKKLIISFILFMFLSIVIFVSCLMIVSFGIGEDGSPGVNVYEIMNSSGKIINIKSITRVGGWIEKLDEDYNIIESWGEKKTAQNHYTKEQFYDLIASNQGSSNSYIGYINYHREAGHDYYYMTIMPRNSVNANATIILNDIPIWNIIFMCLLCGLFLLLCIGMSYYLSRTIKKPLAELTKGMERVRSGEEGVRIVFAAKAEFAEIKDTFNLMMDRLEEEKAKVILNERKKNALLLDLSHDIKTPMSTIKSYVNALEEDMIPEDQKKESYEIIDSKVNRVSNLMDDLFMTLKLDSTEYVVTTERIDICELLREICVGYYGEVVDKGFDFDIDIPEESIEAEIDRKLFSRVIENILTNSIKYNRNGHLIRVLLTVDVSHNVIIKIMDDGTLIEPQIRKNLFDAFVRGDKARKTDGGTGLGLSIARTIIEKHNGSLQYMCEGNFNCFVITI